MTICPTCGAQLGDRRSFGPLSVHLNPPAAYWQGKIFDLSPYQLRLLYALCLSGKLDNISAQMVGSGEEAGSKVAEAQLSRMRRRLPPEVKIVSIRGWGYELIVEGFSKGAGGLAQELHGQFHVPRRRVLE